MTPAVHKRFLEYREKHMYFGRSSAILGGPEFSQLDAEFRDLDAKGEGRDDEEEARWTELAQLLFRD